METHPFLSRSSAPPSTGDGGAPPESRAGVYLAALAAFGLAYVLGVRSGRQEGYVKGMEQGERHAFEALEAHHTMHEPLGAERAPAASPMHRAA